MGSPGFRRRLRRYRLWASAELRCASPSERLGTRPSGRASPWGPLGLAGAGTLVVVLVEAVRTSDDQGIAGPLITVCVIAGLAGLVTGVTEGLVQSSPRIELRTRLVLVVLALITAAILGGGAIVAGVTALTGSGVALGSAWFGLRIMSALLPPPDDTGPE